MKPNPSHRTRRLGAGEAGPAGAGLALLLALAAGLWAPPVKAEQSQGPSIFQEPVTAVAPSPNDARKWDLPAGETPIDFAVSPAGPEAAVLTRSTAGGAHVYLWQIASGQAHSVWQSQGAFAPRALVWHPAARALFVLGASAAESVIIRLEDTPVGWIAAPIYRTRHTLRRLVAGPRPFAPFGENSEQFFRLFFGVARADGTNLIASVTEHGERYYELTQKEGAPPPRPLATDEEPPAPFVAASALPEAFHPAGHLMIWVDRAQCFQVAHYGWGNWDKSAPLWGGKICGGSVEATPNGLGLFHWRKGDPGVDLYLGGQEHPAPVAADYTFSSVPLSTADGRGLVAATKRESTSMVYVPIDLPLANVGNAWMFLESGRDRELFGAKSGLFRRLDKNDQIYQLYDSEAYYCSGYDGSTPTRPYLVTTDIFWENFAAAYEGLFILLERRQAIPIFWMFVNEANAALASAGSRWAAAFHALAQLQQHQPSDPEAQRILRAGGVETSSVLGANFNFAELKPRGHYTASTQEQRYFAAFRYLTSLSTAEHGLPATDLESLPAVAQEHARIWIRSYLPFIAPSRAPLVWSDSVIPLPAYGRHPAPLPALFPLAWGFDNETLLSTVFHPDWPADQRIAGPGGNRLLPSGLDVAAALGSPLARTLLAPEIAKYPALAKTLDSLHARAPHEAAHANNLYDLWMDALGTSWADTSGIPGEKNDDVWDVKRLQTGLASWATLRHATVLVNERTEAECGEGGFEWIHLDPPRGYVEPAPAVFEAIAGMFDAAAHAVQDSPALEGGKSPAFLENTVNPQESYGEKPALRDGLLRRLGEAAADARLFGAIARKEIKGQPLAVADYEQILHVGRAAEYHFLIFKSLANPEFALSNPDPMAKIADVAGGGNGIPYLHAAVGAPLEWDQIVPYFGRREIVKGSVYSYYELASPTPLTDAEWRARLANTARPAWVAPYISNEILSCPAKDPY